MPQQHLDVYIPLNAQLLTFTEAFAGDDFNNSNTTQEVTILQNTASADEPRTPASKLNNVNEYDALKLI